jgi:hypothetical protein
MLGTVLVRALCVCVAVCLGPAAAHSTRVNVTTTTTSRGTSTAAAAAPASHGHDGGGGVPQQPSPEFHRKLATQVIYNGKTYSLLSHAAPDITANICQDVYLPLDAGYVIAPDNADSMAVIAAHGWSTHAVIVASGLSYHPNNGGSHTVTTSIISIIGSTYKPDTCASYSFQILQVIYIHALSFNCLVLSLHYFYNSFMSNT